MKLSYLTHFMLSQNTRKTNYFKSLYHIKWYKIIYHATKAFIRCLSNFESFCCMINFQMYSALALYMQLSNLGRDQLFGLPFLFFQMLPTKKYVQNVYQIDIYIRYTLRILFSLCSRNLYFYIYTFILDFKKYLFLLSVSLVQLPSHVQRFETL